MTYEEYVATLTMKELKEELANVKKYLAEAYERKNNPMYHKYIQYQINTDNYIYELESSEAILEKAIESKR
mgnify:CR=1 FL=1